jgi:hypothetical protein
MIRRAPQIVLGVFIIMTIMRCAQIVSLNGGKKDTVPPKLTEAVPLNYSASFNREEIVLKFDEFVQVKDLVNQLIVSPKLKTPPEITAEGKKIRIRFKKEELLPNTTYRFYFGTSIADMNESNSIPDFEYVFSTGGVIDSLKIRGNISEATSNKPVPNVLIGLYYKERGNDSLPFLQEPDYLARSNENGEFRFRNLPYKGFKVYGILDKNKNGLYDGDLEKVSFLENTLKLISDTNIHLNLFQEESEKIFIRRTFSPYYGLAQVFLNKKAKIGISALKPGDIVNISQTNADKERDTVSVYYRKIADTLALVVQLGSYKTDTLRLPVPRKSGTSKKRLKSYVTNISENKLPLDARIQFTFSNWMDTTRSDLSKIRLSSTEDSLVSLVPLKGHWRNINSFEIDHKLKEGVNYTLKTDTNAFFDTDQFTNDTSTLHFRTESRTEFGKLTLKVLLGKKQHYIVQLINQQDKVVRETSAAFSLSSSNAATLDFTDLPPGIYFAKIIFDDNKNGKWDSGNLIRKQQPEKVIIHSKQLKIVSDWEIEEEIIMKE